MVYRIFLAWLAVFLPATLCGGQESSSSVYRNPSAAPAGVGAATAPNSRVATAASAGTLGAPQTPSPPGALAAERPAGPPFQLSEVEQQFVVQLLQMWQNKSAEIKTFNANFERLSYNAFGAADRPMIRSFGQLTYSKPDKGSFKINEIHRWKKTDPQDASPNAAGTYEHEKHELGEHWVCDGKAVYQYVHRDKILEVTPLPPELRGKSIVDGPLPFLFGADANKLMRRYWIRPKQGNPQMIWLEAYPRWKADAMNYSRVEVMLDRKTMSPLAIQVHAPNGQERSVYKFEEPVINGKLDGLFGGLFNAPRTPFGYKRVVVEPTPAGPQAANPAGGVQR